jgi:Holliday junction resolvase RusA-like endonuclease
MSNPLRIEILGEPIPKGRPRVTRKGIAYTPARTRQYETLVRLAWQQAYPGRRPIAAGLPVKIWIDAIFALPASAPKAERAAVAAGRYLPMARRPDADNLAKSILDGLSGVAFAEDGQVSQLCVAKWRGIGARVTVHIEEVTE